MDYKTIGILIDAALLLILILSAFISGKKGFIKEIAGLIAFVLAIALSWTFCHKLGKIINEKIINDKVVAFVNEKVDLIVDEVTQSENKDTGFDESIKKFIDSLPIDSNKIMEKINDIGDSLNITGDLKDKADKAIGTISENLSEKLSVGIAFIAIFFVVSIVAGILLSLLSGLVKATVPKLDSSLGVVVGIIKGLIIVFVLSYLISICAPMFTDEDIVVNTIILKYVCEIL